MRTTCQLSPTFLKVMKVRSILIVQSSNDHVHHIGDRPRQLRRGGPSFSSASSCSAASLTTFRRLRQRRARECNHGND
jgi:hypothetical protein